MLLRCHRIKLNLVFGLQCPEGELLARFSLMKLLTLKDTQGLLEPFINQLDDVELTKVYSQQDSAAAHSTTINWAIGKCKILTKVIHLT
jgi:hypothetical protein